MTRSNLNAEEYVAIKVLSETDGLRLREVAKIMGRSLSSVQNYKYRIDSYQKGKYGRSKTPNKIVVKAIEMLSDPQKSRMMTDNLVQKKNGSSEIQPQNRPTPKTPTLPTLPTQPVKATQDRYDRLQAAVENLNGNILDFLKEERLIWEEEHQELIKEVTSLREESEKRGGKGFTDTIKNIFGYKEGLANEE